MFAFIRYVPLALVLACAPRSVDRAIVTDGGGPAPGSRPTPPTDPSSPIDPGAPNPNPVDAAGPAGLTDATTGARDTAMPLADASARDRLPPDTAAEPPPRPTDAAARDAAASDALVSRNALLVVGDAVFPTAGDQRLRQVLAASRLSVRIASDLDEVDVQGIQLVVLAASCLSTNLGTRYRDLPLPILSTEPAVLDDLGMTGPAEGVDWEETAGTLVNIVLPSHPMAAGLAGPILVVDQPATLTWGKPATTAERVAIFQQTPDRAAIFGYVRLAPMVTGRAPARRVGFFAADDAAATLTDDGIRLLAAAVSWVLR